MCQRCGKPVELVGSRDVGVQILKCHGCGIMDRRLPANRREELEGVQVARFWGVRRIAIAIAIAAAAVAAVLLRLRGLL